MAKREHSITVTIIGPGGLGASLAHSFHAAKIGIDELVLRPRSPFKRGAAALAKAVGGQLAALDDAWLAADVIWLCVPDDAIGTVAEKIAPRLSERQVLLHSSGVLGSDILRDGAAAVGSAHPMMSFTRSRPASLKGVSFAVEGDRRAIRAAAELIEAIGGRSFTIQPEHKALYHAFGTFCSPLLLATLAAGREAAEAAGIRGDKLREISAPILRRTLENYLAVGAPKALSGPLRRGDVATVKMHLDALAALPDIRQIYANLSRFVVTKLPGENKKELLKALATSSRPGSRRRGVPSSPSSLRGISQK